MASFSDSSLQPFTPYIEQLPVNAMVSVGQQKQNQYNDGVQKIQSNIDQVAGMDVIRDVDKQYLQSRLNQLNGNLSKVAAGDFSNHQLVNSVGGMINGIGKDRNIQNAVGSAARYRKGLSDMETAKKEGKSSPSNEAKFLTETSKWMNNPDVEASFEESYIPHSDWRKHGLEILKELSDDKTLTENAFNADGSLADAVIRKSFAGISPEKIQQALMVGLSPANFQQMEIDGVYAYSNMDKKQFVQDLKSTQTSTIDFYKSQKKTLENAKSSTTSVLEKEKLNAQIDSLNKTIEGVNSEYGKIINTANTARQGSLDAAKAQYFTKNSIDQFSKAFSHTETSLTYEGGALLKTAQWREEQNMAWKKILLDKQFSRENIEIEKQKLRLQQKANDIASGDTGDYGLLGIDVDQSTLPEVTVENIIEQSQAKKEMVEDSDVTFLKTQGEDQEWFNQQKEAYDKSPSSVEPLIANHFRTTEKQRREAFSEATMATQVQQEVEDEFGTIDQFIPKNGQQLKYSGPSGEFIYNPKDFVNFNTISDKYYKVLNSGSGTGGASNGIVFDRKKAREELSDKEYNLFRIWANGTETDAEKILWSNIQFYNQNVNQPNKTLLKKIDVETTKRIKERLTWNQPGTYNIPTETTKQKTGMATNLVRFIELAENQKDGIGNSPKFDKNIARKLSNSNDTRYVFKLTEGNSARQADGTQRQPDQYSVIASGDDGSVEFNITPEQKHLIFGDRYESSPELKEAKPYLEQIKMMGGYTTSYKKGKNELGPNYLSKIDFPSVSRYGIRGDIITSSPDQGGAYSFRLHIYDPMAEKWVETVYPRTGVIDAENLVPAMRGLTDNEIYRILKETDPSTEDLKELEKKSTKPLK